MPSTVSLSVVVPAYNEGERINAMLDETLGYLEKRVKSNPDFTYEVRSSAFPSSPRPWCLLCR